MEIGSRPLKTEFFRFVIPSILSQWVYALYNMVDGMFVARGVGELALTAVNLSNPFLQFMFATSLLFAVGTSTVAAIFMGDNQRRRASQVFSQNAAAQLALGVAIIALALPNLDVLATFLGAKDPEIHAYVKEYLRWVAPFAPAFLLSYAFEVLLKTDGFPKKTVLIVTLGAVENCVLDWLFVFVLHRGVGGAAFATGLSQLTVTLLYLHHFLRKKGTIHFVRFQFSLALVGREAANGFSAALTELSTGLTTLLFNRVILLFLPREALVSYAILSYLNTLVVFSVTGIVQGGQPLVSYYHGRGDRPLCHTLLKYSLVTAAAFCAGAAALCVIFAPQITAIYVGAALPELRASSAAVIRIFSVSMAPLGINVAISGYLAAIESAAPAVAISAGRGLVLLAASLGLLTWRFGGAGIWWAPLLSELLTLALALALFRRHGGPKNPNKC